MVVVPASGDRAEPARRTFGSQQRERRGPHAGASMMPEREHADACRRVVQRARDEDAEPTGSSPRTVTNHPRSAMWCSMSSKKSPDSRRTRSASSAMAGRSEMSRTGGAGAPAAKKYACGVRLRWSSRACARKNSSPVGTKDERTWSDRRSRANACWPNRRAGGDSENCVMRACSWIEPKPTVSPAIRMR